MAGEVINPWGVGLDVSDKSLDEMFPSIDPEFAPFGHRVIVQIRRVVNKTSSGIILAKEATETEAYNNTIGKLISVGPLAFKKRTTGEEWPEGIWARPGDFVRVPPDSEVTGGLLICTMGCLLCIWFCLLIQIYLAPTPATCPRCGAT